MEEIQTTPLFTEDDYFENKKFVSIVFCETDIRRLTFEDCIFESCDFSNASLFLVTLRSCNFLRCTFVITSMEKTTLDNCIFKESKIMGLTFATANNFCFSPSFESCLIDSTVFSQNNLKKQYFKNSTIRNSDFMTCNISEADFSGSTFENTSFHSCNLSKADFSNARNYSINPFENKIKNAVFSLPDAQSFLDFLEIKIKG